MISRVVTKDDKTDTWEYSYDLLNQLEQVKKNGDVVSSYIYDPNGFRVEKVGSKGKIHYVPLLNGEVGYRKEFSANAEYSFIYVGGQHLARVNGVVGGSGKKFFYHNDHLGSALAVTDEFGNKIVERDFTPFGERINTDVYDDEPRDTDEDESGFTGKDWDEDVGLYYYNARWYDPGVGRFINQDPVGDDPTFYVYGFNNPLSYIDPSGMIGINVAGGLMNLAAMEIPGLGNIMGMVSLFRMFVAGPPDATSPEAILETKSEGLTQADLSQAGDLYLDHKKVTNRKSLDRDLREDLLKNPVADAIARNNSPATTIKNAVEDVSGLTSGEIEARIEQTYGQAAIDVIRETIGEQDLKEYMNKNGIRNLTGLTSHISKLYSNVDRRRTLIADLGVRKFESTVTSENPLGNGLETMGYVADTAWFLAGGNKKQMADDFGFAFNRDVNGWLPGGESGNNRQWNINQRIINRSPDGWANRFGGLPSTGFKPEFTDSLATTQFDQTHHFAGVFWWTAHYGATSGNAEAFWLETGNGFKNRNDIRLGNAAVDAYNDPMFWRSPSVWIRHYLGE